MTARQLFEKNCDSLRNHLSAEAARNADAPERSAWQVAPLSFQFGVIFNWTQIIGTNYSIYLTRVWM